MPVVLEICLSKFEFHTPSPFCRLTTFPTSFPLHSISFSSLFLPVLYGLFISLSPFLIFPLIISLCRCFVSHLFASFVSSIAFLHCNKWTLYEEPFSEGFVVSWYTDCTPTLSSFWYYRTVNVKFSSCNHQLISYWKLSLYACETTTCCPTSFISITSFVKTFS